MTRLITSNFKVKKNKKERKLIKSNKTGYKSGGKSVAHTQCKNDSNQPDKQGTNQVNGAQGA